MISNKYLRFHFLNVGHGDATIVEFPDYGSPVIARFGIIDFGPRKGPELVLDYLRELIKIRTDQDSGMYRIEFACVTHPHEDHYGALKKFLDEYADSSDSSINRLNSFWDCGFRTTSSRYNNTLKKLILNHNVSFMRLAAGSEFDFGKVHVTVLAPSIDLRNRFDTFGVDKNNASVVLKFKLLNSYAIIAADAEYESWGKITEEFPRTRRIQFVPDALGLAERNDTSDQLKCDLLRSSHHGSMHGTDLRYIERINPNRIIISAGSQQWYEENEPRWTGLFPHPVTRTIVDCLHKDVEQMVTGEEGHILVSYSGGWTPSSVETIREKPGNQAFATRLESVISD